MTKHYGKLFAGGRRALVAACVWLALAAGVVAAQTMTAGAETEADVATRQLGRVRAPELAGGRGWLNTEQPLSLAALRGKVVLLDFWTYGCINCVHIIPDLQRLEERYARQLVVIGVHSAKFDNEKETENIRRIILRYQIEHPVVNDADFRIWDAYAVSAWPTQVLIDPAGYVVGQVSGEGNYAVIDKAIAQLVEDARRRGTLDERPLELALERAKVGDLPLAFPGKVLADAAGDRLFIADSNHNRVVVARLDGTLLYTIGTGQAGGRDGAFDAATFRRPQGLALEGDTLYVADTANHSLRRVDLKARTVSTVAGTGQQSRDYGTRGGPALSTALSSPWDLQLAGQMLYVAMAGPHQIWRLDLQKQELSVFAGSGREARADGSREDSAFAQPSGLTTDGRTLFVADSESNIIRAVSLPASTRKDGGDLPAASPASTLTAPPSSSNDDEEVRTLAGGDLFEFGDRDGRGDEVRLQHPLGVVFHEGRVLIADTYNHKIKELDAGARTVRTFAGTGRAGQTDGTKPAFYEPGGLSVARGHLYVADTNNHAVRVVDLKTKQTVTLVLRGLQPPAAPADSAAGEREADAPGASEVQLAPQKLGADGAAALLIDVALPAGYHLNPSAPHRYRVNVESGPQHLGVESGPPAAGAAAKDKALTHTAKDLKLPLRVPLRAFAAGASELRVRLTLYYCREDNTGVCRIKTLAWRAPVEVSTEAGAPREIKVQGKISEQ